jgi:hypothetical protein
MELEHSLQEAVAERDEAKNAAEASAAKIQELTEAHAALEAQIDNILENCGDDGITQIDVDEPDEESASPALESNELSSFGLKGM